MPTAPHHSNLSPAPRRRATAGAAGLLSLLLALSACGSSTSDDATATTSTDVTTEVLTAEDGDEALQVLDVRQHLLAIFAERLGIRIDF